MVAEHSFCLNQAPILISVHFLGSKRYFYEQTVQTCSAWMTPTWPVWWPWISPAGTRIFWRRWRLRWAWTSSPGTFRSGWSCHWLPCRRCRRPPRAGSPAGSSHAKSDCLPEDTKTSFLKKISTISAIVESYLIVKIRVIIAKWCKDAVPFLRRWDVEQSNERSRFCQRHSRHWWWCTKNKERDPCQIFISIGMQK